MTDSRGAGVAGSDVLLSGIVGSTAYGLAGPDSDVDRLGVFAVPTTALLGLDSPTQSRVITDPDVTLHELGKWLRLALGGNPTAMELVWLPDDLYENVTDIGRELITLRGSLLSERQVKDSYLGYATQQLRRLVTRVDGTPTGNAGRPVAAARRHGALATRTAGGPDEAAISRKLAKHARHLLRLCWQGLHLYRTGELLIRLDEPQRFLDFGERVAAGEIEVANEALARTAAEFNAAVSPLPDEPDRERVDRWLVDVRLRLLDRARSARTAVPASEASSRGDERVDAPH